MTQNSTESFWGGIVKAMGLVFGDVGTSPIYTLTVIFALTAPTRTNVFGILSLVFWTMTILVTVEYAWLAMSLGRKGQGGQSSSGRSLKLVKSGRLVAFAGFLSFLGVSLLLGDGVITPAISILSAVEGMLLIPAFSGLSQGVLVAIAATIAVGLFVIQHKGTDKVARAFGPIMVVWFVALAASGLVSISAMPEIVTAISPHHALNFFRERLCRLFRSLRGHPLLHRRRSTLRRHGASWPPADHPRLVFRVRRAFSQLPGAGGVHTSSSRRKKHPFRHGAESGLQCSTSRSCS